MSKMYEALRKAQLQGVSVDVPVPVMATVGPALPLEADEDPVVVQDRVDSPSQPESRNTREMRQLPIRVSREAAGIPWDISGPGGEQYRIIRTRIVQHANRPKIIMISSPGSCAGKTGSAVNISGVLSMVDNPTGLLIAADCS